MWIYLSFMRRAQREQWFIEHPVGIREITGLTLTSPVPLRSPVAQKIAESGVLSAREEQHLCSTLNLTETGKNNKWISGLICR